jgi:hypothetical protein
MLNRVKQFRRLIILAGATALVGCASVQTTDEWAASDGYRRLDIQGKAYYCGGQAANCLRVAQLRQYRFVSEGPGLDMPASAWEAPTSVAGGFR